MAILLALLAAAANAFATVLQRLGVEQVSNASERNATLMRSVMSRPIWIAGVGLATASFLLQAIALSLGTLVTVQPVMVTEIVFLVAILGIWFKRSLGWREWVGSAGTAAGLGAFLAVSSASGGVQRPTRSDWVLLLIASVGAILAATLLGRHSSRTWRAASFGVAASICFALTAAFIKTAADQWSFSPARIFLHPEVYGVAIGGLAGLVISQHALEAGPVAASQSALLIVNPIASIVMGIWLFGDHLHTTAPYVAGSALSLGVMFLALVVLSSSPLITSTGSAERLSEGSGPVGEAVS